MYRSALALSLIFAATTFVIAEDLTEKDFRRASMYILEDPTGKDAEDMAKAVLLFTAQTEKAGVFIGEEEGKWTSVDKKPNAVLMAAFAAGNVQAQLNSGVVRNDRYSGVMSLFGTYRKMQEKDKKFKSDTVEELLKLHKDDKLTAYLTELDKKKPMPKKES